MSKKIIIPDDDEDLALTKAAMADPDNLALSDAQLAEMRPASEVVPHIVEEHSRTRGKQKTPLKTSVTIRLDDTVVEHFKATGKGWQSRINEALLDVVRDG